MNCAAVQIGEGSGDSTTPTNPPAPSVSATKPTKPSSPAYQPSQPEGQDQYSAAPAPTSTPSGRPSSPAASASPYQPDNQDTDEESDDEPSYQAPPENDDSDYTDSSDEEDDNNYDQSDEETNNRWSKGNGRWNSHRHQTWKYRMIEDHKCKIDTVAKRAECDCKASSGCSAQKRAEVERKAVRMVRRDAIKKRAEACAWDSAPSMVVSYYTVDAACAPNAKMNVPESDTFEIGWSEPCGVVEGDGQYPIKEMDCNMFS